MALPFLLYLELSILLRRAQPISAAWKCPTGHNFILGPKERRRGKNGQICSAEGETRENGPRPLSPSSEDIGQSVPALACAQDLVFGSNHPSQSWVS